MWGMKCCQLDHTTFADSWHPCRVLPSVLDVADGWPSYSSTGWETQSLGWCARQWVHTHSKMFAGHWTAPRQHELWMDVMEWQPELTLKASQMSSRLLRFFSWALLHADMMDCLLSFIPLPPHKGYCTYYDPISRQWSHLVASCHVQYLSCVAMWSCPSPCMIHISEPLIWPLVVLEETRSIST